MGITHAIIGGLHHRQVKKLEPQQGTPTTTKTAQIRANSLSKLDFATSLSALEEEFNVSPITPENFLMNDPEEFHVGNALAGFRAETVPETDLKQGLGPHADDMTSYRTYEDGTCSLIVTDGEGGSPAEVYNASHNKTIVMENSIPYVMIDWGALDQFYYQHFKQELDKLGGKTDGASLIAAFAKS